MLNGFYYNFSRKNLRSTVFKCRATFNDVKCTGRFTLKNDNSYELKNRCIDCKPNLPIECDIMKDLLVVINEMERDPSTSIQQLWELKQNALPLKYEAKQEALYWPGFHSVMCSLFSKKNKLVPKLLTSVSDLKELKEPYIQTKTKLRFFASLSEKLSDFISFVSLIGLTILANSENGGVMGHSSRPQNGYY